MRGQEDQDLSNTLHFARTLPPMTTTATTSLNPSDPLIPPQAGIPRIRALLALLAQLIIRSGAAAQVDQLFAEAEARLARYLLHLAIRETGDPYLSADMYDARIIWRGALFDVDIRLRRDAIHPFTRIIVLRDHAGRLMRHRRAYARRHRFSRKFHNIIARANARRAAPRAARHSAHTQFILHTPSRVAAPP